MQQQFSDDAPLLICIESSGTTCGIALARAHTIIAELAFFERHVHDRLMAQSCGFLCDALGVRVDELQAVAVSAGPGSFTGLRIGAAFAKALCFPDDFSQAPSNTAPRLIAVPTLQAVAYTACDAARLVAANHITAVIPSHKNLVYAQSFDTNGNPLDSVRLIEFEKVLEHSSEGGFYCGSAFAGREPEFRTLPHLTTLKPDCIARLGWRQYERGEFADAMTFAPLYGQEFVPKV